MTAKIFKGGTECTKCQSLRRPRYEEGKKITWRDGVVALWVLLSIALKVNSFFRLLVTPSHIGPPGWRCCDGGYAVAPALGIYLIRAILDRVLPTREGVQTIALALVAPTWSKASDSTFRLSMEDVGQRVVMDLRDASTDTSSAVGELLFAKHDWTAVIAGIE